MAGARTLFIRTPQGEEALVVHKTSQVLDGREVWASADGIVAILEDGNSLREEGVGLKRKIRLGRDPGLIMMMTVK